MKNKTFNRMASAHHRLRSCALCTLFVRSFCASGVYDQRAMYVLTVFK
jgi:hypothetical protein